MKVAYSYSWLLPAGTLAYVREIIDKLRNYAVELGGDAGDVVVLTGDEAGAVRPGSRVAVIFTATIPGASEGRYGLAVVTDSSWSWSGAIVVSDVRKVGELHAAAAALSMEVVEEYAGMVFTSKKNGEGVVEVEQRLASDWTDF